MSGKERQHSATGCAGVAWVVARDRSPLLTRRLSSRRELGRELGDDDEAVALANKVLLRGVGAVVPADFLHILNLRTCDHASFGQRLDGPLDVVVALFDQGRDFATGHCEWAVAVDFPPA